VSFVLFRDDIVPQQRTSSHESTVNACTAAAARYRSYSRSKNIKSTESNAACIWMVGLLHWDSIQAYRPNQNLHRASLSPFMPTCIYQRRLK
jgi:hypothetical protein